MMYGKYFLLRRNLPIMGPKIITNNALPIKCHPKAAGSFSIVQNSETVKVKLAKAAPLKKPQTESQITN